MNTYNGSQRFRSIVIADYVLEVVRANSDFDTDQCQLLFDALVTGLETRDGTELRLLLQPGMGGPDVSDN